ncbi:Uncharacterized protein FWK35_00004994, partial [Aphis craccivora]
VRRLVDASWLAAMQLADELSPDSGGRACQTQLYLVAGHLIFLPHLCCADQLYITGHKKKPFRNRTLLDTIDNSLSKRYGKVKDVYLPTESMTLLYGGITINKHANGVGSLVHNSLRPCIKQCKAIMTEYITSRSI